VRLAAALVAGWLAASGASAAPALEKIATILLEGVSGRIDHMAVDVARHRLLVAELGNGTVDVVDLAAGRVSHRITGLKAPQGVGYVPKDDLIVVASAGDGTVQFFAGGDFEPAGKIDLGDDADNVRVDPASGQVVVGFGDGGLAFIDPQTRTLAGKAKLSAHPEGFQFGADDKTIMVNVPNNHEIAVVDRIGLQQTGSWKTPGQASNFPMALVGDDAVASVFRNPARLALFGSAKGSILATQTTCGDADDVFFDRGRRRLYISCGEGAIDVEGWDGKALTRLDRITTGSGARTSLFVPELDRLYVAQRAGLLGGQAAILVFRPSP
jgi:DNA-binding beta-propeller fold protein YncE